MDQVGESPRGLHAIRVLTARRDFTLDSLMKAAYDPYLTAFARYVPLLLAAYDRLPAQDSRKAALAASIDLLRSWDYRWGLQSQATSLAVYWGEGLWRVSAEPAKATDLTVWDYIAERTSDTQKLTALEEAVRRLTHDFGSFRVPWGEINRFQRNDGAIVQTFDDAKPSTPVPFTASRWGSLAAFGAETYPGTRRRYGTVGNSFVAVVEFGPTVHALAVTAGGESGHPDSPHFKDEVQRYADGNLRPVYFYPDELQGHIERRYRPGE
jgi:acyl-homoserine-lactone acylase